MRPPGPGPLASPLTLRRLRADPPRFFERLRAEHGDVSAFSLGPWDVVLVAKPEHVHDVFVTHHKRFTKGRGLAVAKRLLGQGMLTSEGDFHRRQRRLAQPAFRHERIRGYGAVMVDKAERAVAERLRPGAELDIGDEMMRLTLAIVSKTLFDSDTDDAAVELGEALTKLLERFIRMTTAPWLELLEKAPLPLPRKIENARALAVLDGIVNGMIAERRRSGEDRGDLLSMLLLAEDPENPGESMSDVQVRDEAMTLFLAGHETTALALTWTLYLLSQHADAEERVRRELDHVLGGRAPTVEDVPKLRVTEQTFAEAMRLYPPAWAIGRRAIEDHPLGDLVVKKGSFLMLSPWVVHRSPNVWRDPERFDPTRFSPDERAKRPKFAYFPFGGGPRTCIGEGFAWMEGTLVLATLLQKRAFRLAPGQVVDVQPLITLRPKHGMRMRISERA